MPAQNFAARMGRWSAQHRRKAILGWLAFVIISLGVGGALGTKTIANEDSGTGESRRADQAIADAFPDRAGEEVVIQGVAARHGSGAAENPRFKAAVNEVVGRLTRFDNVRDVQSPLAPGNDSQISFDGRSALITFDLLGDDEQLDTRVEPVLAAVAQVQDAHPELRIEEFGDASADKAITESFEDDLQKAETLSLPITLIILVIAFGALAAAGVPLLLALSAVAATMGLIGLVSQAVPFDESISSVILLVGLAVGVDYSLFYLRREREERAAGRSPEDALQTAAATSGRAVLVSGCTVMVAMAGMYIAGSPTFQSFATGTIMVVGIAMIGSLTVLPAVLSKLGDRVDKGRVPFRRTSSGADGGGIWSAIVTRVLRHPVIAAVLTTSVLIAMAIPAFGLHTLNPGVQGIPKDLAVKKTYDRIQAAFPGDPLPATIALAAPDVTTESMRTAIARLRIRAVATGQFNEPATVTISPDKKVARVDMPIVGDGTNDRSDAALAALRDDVIPFVLADHPEASADVTGITAESIDFNDLLKARAPFVFLFVLALAFVLLLTTFRSIVIPIKAIVLNLLSVGAAYGVLVFIFQDGRLEGALDYESVGGITSWLPLFLFVLLFGLSMDYHVFILTRVREAYDRGMTTEAAVAHGIRTTAGVVTSAAIVMVAVFGIFATLSALELKQMGVGLAVAVLIDATLIRAVLLPASMKLLGDWNWYLPKWLEWLPQVAPEEPAPAAALPTDPALGIQVDGSATTVRVRLTGELDIGTADALNARLEEIAANGPELLVLDVRKLDFMDSSGLRVIVGAVRAARAEGRRAVLLRGRGPIESMLDVTRVDQIMETVDDPAAVGFPDEGGGAN